ncbi:MULTISPECIES: hypothetical protein [Streptomyces]|uniref:DUF4352 domain-containing protein n=1 Tax=Streptomyces evansiae TaxID=3075535 RepID=A0ABU2R803_9ACTN|nr:MULTISPECIES: hypothetical protein [unclassified Streptomyces]MDT0412827.1 hypothetical protein [Streptomyces sp. DSM 41979]MYQ59514.1 hypothetical protein [Streptomyces sp. SID4926]
MMNSLSMRTSRRARCLAVTVVVAGLFGVAGCGGDEGGKESPPSAKSSVEQSGDSKRSASEGAPSQTAEESLATAKDGDVAVVIHSAVRDQNGGYVTVSGTVTNNGGGPWSGAEWRSDESELRGNGGSVAGATLVDPVGKKRYLILRDTLGKCLCTKFDGQVDAGQTVDWFAQFPAPPASTKKVTFQVGSMPPAEIPLSEAQ